MERIPVCKKKGRHQHRVVFDQGVGGHDMVYWCNPKAKSLSEFLKFSHYESKLLFGNGKMRMKNVDKISALQIFSAYERKRYKIVPALSRSERVRLKRLRFLNEL